jgi:hypothetical protein
MRARGLVVELRSHESFQQLLSYKGICPRTYDRRMEAMQASETMEIICELGNRVLILARAGAMPVSQAEAVLLDLTKCFMGPLACTGCVAEIERKLRGL